MTNYRLLTSLLNCLKPSGPVFYCFDANFGLVRKQNSGQSLLPPKQEGSFFLSEQDVESFVQAYNTDRTKDKVSLKRSFIERCYEYGTYVKVKVTTCCIFITRYPSLFTLGIFHALLTSLRIIFLRRGDGQEKVGNVI